MSGTEFEDHVARIARSCGRAGDHDVGHRRLGRRPDRRQSARSPCGAMQTAVPPGRRQRRSGGGRGRADARLHQDHGRHQPRIHPRRTQTRGVARLRARRRSRTCRGCASTIRRLTEPPTPTSQLSASRTAATAASISPRDTVSAGRNRTLSVPLASMTTRRSHSRRISSSRCSAARQAERAHQPAAADVEHQSGELGRQLVQPGEQIAARLGGVLHQPVGLDDLEDAPRPHHVHQVAAPGGVDPRADREHVVGDLVDAAAGHHAAHLGLLAERDHVGRRRPIAGRPKRFRSARSRSAPRRRSAARRTRRTARASPRRTAAGSAGRRPHPGSARR